jgi:formamidase
MKSITVDYTKRLAEEPGKGHNRWHEAIAPVIEAAPGEEVEIQTRDAFDGQISEALFFSLSTRRPGGEGRVRGADVPVRGATHLTLPTLWVGPRPLPPEGR